MRNTFSILGATTTTALQAAGADITVNNHTLSVTGCPDMDFRKIITTTGLLATVAEVLSINTISNTGAASTYFSFIMVQIQNGNPVYFYFSYQSAASGDTTTTISDAFKRQFDAYGSNIKATRNATGAATFIITASAGYPIITGWSTSGATVTVPSPPGTPGVMARGTYASILATPGAYPSVSPASGRTYYTITWKWVAENANDQAGQESLTPNYHTMYIDSGDPNIAAFVTKMGETINAYTPGTTVSNPENLSLA